MPSRRYPVSMSEKPRPAPPANDDEARFDDEGSAVGHPEPDESKQKTKTRAVNPKGDEVSTAELTARELATRFYEAFDAGDIDAVLSVFSDDLETTDPGMGTVNGHAPFREYIETLKRAVPDARVVIDGMYDAGDVVVVEGRFAGKFIGPLTSPDGDIEPTGASVDLRFADVSRARESKIVSYHTYYDQLGLLTQLGVMEP